MWNVPSAKSLVLRSEVQIAARQSVEVLYEYSWSALTRQEYSAAQTAFLYVIVYPGTWYSAVHLQLITLARGNRVLHTAFLKQRLPEIIKDRRHLRADSARRDAEPLPEV